MSNKCQYELLKVVIASGQGSKVLEFSKKIGVKGGTLVLAKGTRKNALLKVLELDEIKREVVMMVVKSDFVETLAMRICEKFQLKSEKKGIIFSTRVETFLGYHDYEYDCENKKEELSMFDAIYIIVDKGKGEQVLDEANKVGAKGATLMKGRGSGIHEQTKIFNMPIEPEKDIVMIITKENKTEKITTHIRDKFEISKPGKGIIFVQKVSKIYGIKED